VVIQCNGVSTAEFTPLKGDIGANKENVLGLTAAHLIIRTDGISRLK
jgi:hypothetical protein